MNLILAILIPATIALVYIPVSDIMNLPVKLFFSALVAIPLNRAFQILEGGGFWNYMIWMTALNVITMMMYWLPRSKNCLSFGINFILFTVLSLWVVRDFAPEMVEWVDFKPLHYTVLILFCGFWAFRGMKNLVEKRDLPKNWLCHIDRGIASVIMTAALVYCAMHLFSVTLDSVLLWILAVVFCAAWFALDLFVYRKFAYYFSVKSKLSDTDKVNYQNPFLFFKDPMTKEERREWRKQFRKEMREETRKLSREFWSGIGHLSLDIIRDINEASLLRQEQIRLEQDLEESRRNNWYYHW